jgi:hypothetical protein
VGFDAEVLDTRYPTRRFKVSHMKSCCRNGKFNSSTS